MNETTAAHAARPLRVLFTAQSLEGRPGGSLYVRDLMLELMRRGHLPVAYATRLGALAEEMRSLTLPVSDRLETITATPDIIHGNTPVETVAALLHFPDTPAVFACHGWESRDAAPPRFPRIVRYLAVDETCFDRLVCHEGIPEDRVVVHQNAVDLARFRPRPPLPEKPRRALIFSNYAADANYVPAVRQACEAAGVALDVLGAEAGRPCEAPERVLGSYDVVFAKARCALEALAVGTAVILCDTSGLGPMVTSREYAKLRSENLGRRALRNPVTTALVAAELARYNAVDAAAVAECVRSSASLAPAVEPLVDIYRSAIDEFRHTHRAHPIAEHRCAAAFLESIAPFANTIYAAEQMRAAAVQARASERDRVLAEMRAMEPLTASDREGIRLPSASAPPSLGCGEAFTAVLEVVNGSTRLLGSHQPCPLNLSYHWMTASRSSPVVYEGQRTSLRPPLPPGTSYRYPVSVKAPERPGTYVLRLTLVQEAVSWLDESGLFADVPVQVG